MPFKRGAEFAIASTLFFLMFSYILGLERVSLEKSHDFPEKERYLSDILVGRVRDIVFGLTRGLEGFNDRRRGNISLAKWPRYDEMKSTLDDAYAFEERTSVARNVKKMGMAMMPLVFHVGATSTWMMLTALMSFKSVALMLVLLVFKIAVSAAKVSSFFTQHYGQKEHISWATPHHGYAAHDYEHVDGWARSKAMAIPSEGYGGHGPYSQRYDSLARSEVEDLEEKKNLLRV